MTKREHSFEGPLPRGKAANARGEGRHPPSLDAAWRNAMTKQNTFDLRKAVVEDLRRQLDELCSDIVANGSNTERIYQVRMFEASLVQARRQVEIAHSQLQETIGELRRIHAARHDSGNGAQTITAIPARPRPAASG